MDFTENSLNSWHDFRDKRGWVSLKPHPEGRRFSHRTPTCNRGKRQGQQGVIIVDGILMSDSELHQVVFQNDLFFFSVPLKRNYLCFNIYSQTFPQRPPCRGNLVPRAFPLKNGWGGQGTERRKWPLYRGGRYGEVGV